jgi:outer membrane usher protein
LSLGPRHKFTRVFLAAAFLLAPLLARAQGQEQTMLLAVIVNERATDKIVEFRQRGGDLVATRSELRGLGLQVPPGPDNGEIALGRLTGLKFRVDQRQQVLHISVPVETLALTRINAQEKSSLRDVPITRDRGAVLNYDVFAMAAKGSVSGSGVFEGRLFTPAGLLTGTMLATAGNDYASVRRLDTTYTFADPYRLRRYSVGDVITGGLPWTRPVRFGGLQFSTDFGLRPDLVTFPLPTLSGQAAVPSTVDVLVNGVQQLSRGIDPGPFSVQQLPVVTGAGTITLLVKDASGQQRVETLPFYASGALLAPGLTSLSAEIGALRKYYATDYDSYDEIAAQGTLRYGMSSMATLEGHVEATARLANLGAGAVFDLGHFAIMSVGAGLSRYEQETGALLYGSVERLTSRYRLAASAQLTDERYRDIAGINGDKPARLVVQAAAGLNLPRIGSLGAAFTHVERKAGLAGQQSMQHSSTLSGTFSRQLFSDAYFYGTGFYRFDESGSSGVVVGFTTRFGETTTAGASASAGPNGTSVDLSLSRPAIDPGDVGWQAYASQGTSSRAMAEVSYRAPYALLSAGVDQHDGQVATRMRAEGAVALLRGRILASNRIQDSFALVDTSGIPNLRVLRENRPAGKTDAHGQLLISDLRSFEANKITIDPADLPIDADARSTTLFVRPYDRSGVLARFNIKQESTALVTLHDAAGAPLPLGSTAVLAATRARMPVGYDGQVYVVGIARQNTLTVTLPNQKRCIVSFAFQPVRGSVPEIGPLICKESLR